MFRYDSDAATAAVWQGLIQAQVGNVSTIYATLVEPIAAFTAGATANSVTPQSIAGPQAGYILSTTCPQTQQQLQAAWRSGIGSFSITVLAGVATVTGACPMRYLKGTYQTMIDFGAILGASAYTLCTVHKFDASATQKYAIFSASDGSSAPANTYNLNQQQCWVQGNWAGYSGCAYSGAGSTSYASLSASSSTEPWTAFCVASASSYSLAYTDNFKWAGTTPYPPGPVGASGSWSGSTVGSIQINTNLCAGLWYSDFNVLEVMSWGRALSQMEIANVLGYLQVVTEQTTTTTTMTTSTITPCRNDWLDLFPVNKTDMISWFQHQNLSETGQVCGCIFLQSNVMGSIRSDPGWSSPAGTCYMLVVTGTANSFYGGGLQQTPSGATVPIFRVDASVNDAAVWRGLLQLGQTGMVYATVQQSYSSFLAGTPSVNNSVTSVSAGGPYGGYSLDGSCPYQLSVPVKSSGTAVVEAAWPSSIGSFSLTVLTGNAWLGGACPMRYLAGNYQTMVDFGTILGTSEYSFCTVVKYASDATHKNTLFVASMAQNLWSGRRA